MILTGSEWLARALHAVSQGLLVPVIVGLLVFFSYVLVELGALLSEYRARRGLRPLKAGDLAHSLRATRDLHRVLNDGALPPVLREALAKVVNLRAISPGLRRAVARRILDEEEMRRARVVDRTDLMVRLGPALGLMGTLIPLGPGLAALGRGDVKGLAQAVIIAFDTTVVGLAVGGMAFFISRVRRRWYQDYLSILETLMECVLEAVDRDEQEKVATGL
jgi:biopolymer transport protein ExbB/TolQ